MARSFHVEMIKPSHYDDEGYIVQWWKASIPSNSLASVYAIVQDAAGRRVLSDAVELTLDGWDECNTVISENRVARELPPQGVASSSSWACRVISFLAPWIWHAGDFARNRHWPEILDRIIELHEQESLRLSFLIQVDALAYRVPN